MGVHRARRGIKTNTYRPYRCVERDSNTRISVSQIIPIHHQSFPLHQPLLACALPCAIPIHHQVFLFPDDATNDDEGTPRPATIKSYRTGVPGGPSSEREMIQNVKGAAERYRQEHKIRNLNVVIGRFISSGNAPLERPPVHSQAVHGDLYIHHYENRVQIWLRDGDQWLPDIKDGCHHPTLPEYRLYVAKGVEPTWVTRKTRSTYKGRLKNRVQRQEDVPNNRVGAVATSL
ncbi:hypothetical protein BKA82DRAFT_4179077 [Pisolithus tinctorius]|nr:hypothetical protein BKA82DRAFT_4179077 [Pisolithus tinctorius]